ncbi:MAG: GNAT family N-acetyltransferase [Desulfovibrio sp.]|nr:GNAT family N-acetyltransferase [Desulfovibrio sp.]
MIAGISAEQLSVWNEAAVTTNQADPFCCAPVWQLAFHDAFSPKRRLLLGEASNSLIAFAEKVFSPDNVFLTPIEAHWFFGCPLLGAYSVDLLSEAMDGIVKCHAPFFPKIMVSGIRPGGAIFRRLRRLFGKGFHFFLHSEGMQCAASLAGGVDGFLSRRSANHRHKLRKEARRAAERGICFERVIPASPEESEAAYSRMLSVERASWKGIDRCGMAEPPARQFYAFMLRRLSFSGGARVIFARREGRDIGFIFGGMAGKMYRGQQFSYADGWKRFSIGNLMQMEQVMWLCEEKARRYDMGPLAGPRMSYKAHWTEIEIPIQTWVLMKK